MKRQEEGIGDGKENEEVGEEGGKGKVRGGRKGKGRRDRISISPFLIECWPVQIVFLGIAMASRVARGVNSDRCNFADSQRRSPWLTHKPVSEPLTLLTPYYFYFLRY